MNYISQINGFWERAESQDLTGIDIAVYFGLLHYCNKLNWLNPFICHWDIACQYTKVSKNAYYKSVEKLQKLGFIIYQKGERNSSAKPKMFILQLENKEGIKKEQRGNKEGTNEEQRGNLYKHVNNKTDKLINNASASENVRSEILSEEEFLKIWAGIRKEFDNKPTHIKKLNFHEKQKFDEWKKIYSKTEFTQAMTGLFSQKNMFDSNRLRPTHFLERFEDYLDCYHNNTQLFKKPAEKKYNFESNR